MRKLAKLRLRAADVYQYGNTGIDFGQLNAGWGKTQPLEVIIKAIVGPNADIARFKTSEIIIKNGKTIQGFLLLTERSSA